PSPTSADDTILPFEVAALDVRGRVVRLGAVIDDLLTRHQYPVPVAKLLGEAVVLTILLGSSLKLEGRFILQTQTDGPVRMLVVDYTTPDRVRACAQYDASRVAAAIEGGEASAGALIGRGHLAMTIDRGLDRSRYQGLVALDGGSLEDAAHEYFRRSEQIPTRVRLAVAEELRGGPYGVRHRWRAGGILAQFLPRAPERMRGPDLDPGDVPAGISVQAGPGQQEDDAWIEGVNLGIVSRAQRSTKGCAAEPGPPVLPGPRICGALLRARRSGERGPQLMVRSAVGLSSEKAGISISK